MRAGTQFSVFLVDKPGVLVKITDAIAQARVNVTALTLMDSVEHGVLRFVCEDPERARTALRSLNIPMTETDVLMVELPNRPGAMADLCARFGAEHISIKYAYVTAGAPGGRTLGVFKVSDMKRALKVANHRPGKKRPDAMLRRPRALRA
ncbi:MAG: ACT domain-containing protein [Phycisphaerae bacterium]|nr:ACT domain-containing protein [Phycisphaerae bacterium]